MYLLIAIFLMVFFCIGYGLGLLTPILIKKYFSLNEKYNDELNLLKNELKTFKDELNNSKTNTPEIDNDTLNEWFTGEEVGDKDE